MLQEFWRSSTKVAPASQMKLRFATDKHLMIAPQCNSLASNPNPQRLQAARIIKRLPGSCKPLLIQDTTHRLWVVKFTSNPENPRVVVNEFLSCHLSSLLGLTVPGYDTILVDREVLVSASGTLGYHESFYKAGHHFASEYVGGTFPGVTLPTRFDLSTGVMMNADEKRGILALDIWLGNEDFRQAINVRSLRSKDRYTSFWIDFSHCLGASRWNFKCWNPLIPSIFAAKARVGSCLEPFEGWLRRIQTISREDILFCLEQLHHSWLKSDALLIDELVHRILRRGEQLPSLVQTVLRQAESLGY